MPITSFAQNIDRVRNHSKRKLVSKLIDNCNNYPSELIS